jgi:hypothetical protein
MKNLYVSFAKSVLLIVILLVCSVAQAQTLYNQNGDTVNAYNSTTDTLVPGWYYSEGGAPRYYYANGVYYDPSTQSYDGVILYPKGDGPQSLSAQSGFTPGVPNTGLGGRAVYGWLSLLISAGVAVAGTQYLTRSKTPL